jgi:hypothetical protein
VFAGVALGGAGRDLGRRRRRRVRRADRRAAPIRRRSPVSGLGLDRSDEIVQLYGHGFKAPASNASEQFCYWDESRQLGAQFRLDARGVVDGVNVAEVPEQIDKA